MKTAEGGCLYVSLGRTNRRPVPTQHLRQQQKLAGGFAAFEVAMGLLGFGQRIGVLDVQLQLAGGDHAEDRAGAGEQLGSGGGEVSESGAGEK